METNLLLTFSNVFNYNLTMYRKEIFDENSVFDEFNNIVAWIKAFLKYDDKYQAFTNFVKDRRRTHKNGKRNTRTYQSGK